MDRTSSQKLNLWPVALAAGLAFYHTLPFLLKIDCVGGRDWDLFTTMAAVPVGAIVDYGQFPFWNMYLGGGNILFHHPEVLVLSPFFPLYLIFGAVVGLKLQVLICYFLGFWGSYRLSRQLGLSAMAAVLVMVAYFGSVYFALHFAEGHMPFTHFCLLPWFVYFGLRSVERPLAVIWAAIALALMILGNGAATPLLYTLLFSGMLFGLCSITQGSLRPVGRWASAVAVGMLLAAVKLVPMLVYLYENSWTGDPNESIPVSALGSIFFGLDQTLYARNFPGQVWAWHEYGAYVSPVLLILAAVALAYRFRKLWPWVAMFLLFLLLGLGNFGWFSPWSILAQMPGFASARCTGRAFQMVILTAAILGGFGLDTVRDRLRPAGAASWPKFVLIAAIGLIGLTNMALAWPIMSSPFKNRPKQVTRDHEFMQVVNDETAFDNFRANRGSLRTPWLSAYHPSRGLVDLTETAYLDFVLSGEIEVVSRDYTPNRIEYRLNVIQPGELIIGMGFDPGWLAADGRPLHAVQDLIAIPVAAGDEQIVLTYRPPLFFPGLVLSLLTLAGLGVLLKQRHKLPEKLH